MYNHSDESVQYMKNDSTPHHTSQEKNEILFESWYALEKLS